MTLVTVLGGTGFLGRHLVAAFSAAGARVRVAVRHPERVKESVRSAGGPSVPVEAVLADVRDQASLASAVAGAEVAVNAVSLYAEGGGATYRSIHLEGARNLAAAAEAARCRRLLHISGIGADPASASRYIACRGAGEEAVRAVFPRATILRPSVLFGPDDRFLNSLVAIARRTPVLPLVGARTGLQPVHVEDVAEAARRLAERPEHDGAPIALGGPDRLSLEEIVRDIYRRLGRRALLVPLPFALARPLARLAELLPQPPMTLAQVELLERDNFAEGPGLAVLGIAPRPLRETLALLLPARE